METVIACGIAGAILVFLYWKLCKTNMCVPENAEIYKDYEPL